MADRNKNGKRTLHDFVVTVSVEHFRAVRAYSPEAAERRAVEEAKKHYGMQGSNVQVIATERTGT